MRIKVEMAKCDYCGSEMKIKTNISLITIKSDAIFYYGDWHCPGESFYLDFCDSECIQGFFAEIVQAQGKNERMDKACFEAKLEGGNDGK